MVGHEGAKRKEGFKQRQKCKVLNSDEVTQLVFSTVKVLKNN